MAAGVACALLVSALSGCSSTVTVTVPAQAAACGSPSWPRTVGTAAARAVSVSSPAVAAWGDPAIVARCGLPALTPTTDPCVTVDGVDWVARQGRDATTMASYGTNPAVEVRVPARYGPAPLLMPAFSAVARALPHTGHHCV